MQAARLITILGGAFTPARILRGSTGVFDLWADLSTVYQDSSGTTAAAFGSPIGLTKDKSGSGSDLTASTTARPTLTAYGAQTGALFDGAANVMTSASGGGGTAGFFWCASVNVVGGAGTARLLWSDTVGSSGYRVKITSSNTLQLSAGNGTALTLATTAATLSVGTTYVLTAWDDGANLNIQINSGPVAQAIRPVVSAGSAGFSIAKDPGTGTFANVAYFAQIYKKNGGVTDSDRTKCQAYCAAKAGISI